MRFSDLGPIILVGFLAMIIPSVLGKVNIVQSGELDPSTNTNIVYSYHGETNYTAPSTKTVCDLWFRYKAAGQIYQEPQRSLKMKEYMDRIIALNGTTVECG